MNRTEHLLTILAEECGEVTQRVCKVLRFGLADVQEGQGEDNKRRLEREAADVVAMIEMLGLDVRDEDKAAKRARVEKYLEYSRKVGTLKDGKVKAVHCYGLICVKTDDCKCPCLDCVAIVNF